MFEAAAWLSAIAVGWQVKQRYLRDQALPLPLQRYPFYMLVIWIGAIAGAFAVGSLNLVMAGLTGMGRSIIGAILGGIIAAEVYKALNGVRGSTGAVFVMPLAVAIAIGRIGCFFAGLADYTHGVETTMPWGVDFGDGVLRHPVQIYESAAMFAFIAVFAFLLRVRPDFCFRYGFYLFVLAYSAQRLVLESLKPYPAVIGPLNLFQIVCLLLIAYAVAMPFVSRRVHAPA